MTNARTCHCKPLHPLGVSVRRQGFYTARLADHLAVIREESEAWIAGLIAKVRAS